MTDGAGTRFGRRALLAWGALLIAAVPFALVLLLIESSWAPLHGLDERTSTGLHRYAVDHPAFVTVMRAVTDTGSPTAWTVILAPVFGWLAYRRRYRMAVFVAVTALGSWLLNNTIKQAVGRVRPHLDHPVATAVGASFPSGHTQATVVGYGILLLVFVPVLARRYRLWAIGAAVTMVVLVGFSRVALGVHYLSDVIGAALIGTAWLLAMTAAFSTCRDLGTPPVDATTGRDPERRQARPS